MSETDPNQIGEYVVPPLPVVCEHANEGEGMWAAYILGLPERALGRTPVEAGSRLLDALRERGVRGQGQLDGAACHRLREQG